MVALFRSYRGDSSRGRVLGHLIEWFSKRKGMSVDNGARSKNIDKKLGRERRPVVSQKRLSSRCNETVNVVFVLEHPNLGSLKITITFEFSVS